MKTLRLIFGDQLNPRHSWFKENNKDISYVFMEIRSETDYVRHHIQKICAIFGGMRDFAAQLKKDSHNVIYLKLDDPKNKQSFPENLKQLQKERSFEKIEYQEPDEYRLDQLLKKFSKEMSIPVEQVSSEHFLTDRFDLKDFFDKRGTQPLMETFYRQMRRKYDILMEKDKPATGKWNYDAANRKGYKKGLELPDAKSFNHDVSEIYEMVKKQKVDFIGTLDPRDFAWPLNRQEALQLLDYFIEKCLVDFGTYQDAMTQENRTLFHSRLSFALNTKMLSPLAVVKKVEQTWQDNPKKIDIAQAEGFIRQIIGWREYMRGIYWAYMPDFAKKNFFLQRRKLPQWFWTGETKMNCLKQAIGQSLETAYAHHIQRLMVTGNFALLAGIHPDEVDAWYLGIYIDAFEWVEITNTRGMSQHADGGIVGTKPYISSANYINKMSDYCGSCDYDYKKRTGEKACPFNSLYWNFLDRKREKLRDNPRMNIPFSSLKRMNDKTLNEIYRQAEKYLNELDDL